VARVKGLHYGGGAEGTMEGSHKKKVGEVRQLDIGMYIPVSRVVPSEGTDVGSSEGEKQANSEVEIPSRPAILMSHRSCICRCYQLFEILRPIFASNSSVRGLDFHGLSTQPLA
jgi:hypothetical protein